MSDVHVPPSVTSSDLPQIREEQLREESDGPVPRHLHGVPDIRGFFRTNTAPVYFFGPTAFNLLGIDRWVRNFHYVAYYDSWDGAHPRVFSPRNKPQVEFDSGEAINNYLLRDPEVQAFIAARPGGEKVAMVFFNEETERICEELGYELILPPDTLRRRLDSKIVTTELGNEAGAPSVPNVLVEVDSWHTLVRVATDAWLAMQRTANLQEVHAHLLSVYDVDSQVLSRDLLRLVEQMSAKGLLRIEA